MLEITFSSSVRPLLDNVALVLLSRSYRFSGSKDPPLLEVVFLLPRSYRFLEVKSPIFRNSLLFVAPVCGFFVDSVEVPKAVVKFL